MKENRNIKKIFQTIVFTFIAFFIFGVVNVNAETVKTVSNLDELNDSMNDNVDVIKLNADITANDTLWWPINSDNKILDLNGFSITSSQNIMFKLFYYGDYTAKVINSSNSKGNINHTYPSEFGNIFYLDNGVIGKNKTLYIDGININESGKARTVLCHDSSNSNDSLIVNNVNARTGDFSMGFDNYKFSNTVLTPIFVNTRVSLVQGSSLKVKDVLGDDQEAYYQAYNTVGGTKLSEGVAADDLAVTDLWTNSTHSDPDNSIVIRYKNGFTVSNVELNEFYGYGISTPTEISIKNRGTSDLQIKNVSVDSSNFKIEGGSQTNLSAGETDTSWTIKATDGLDKGVYTAIITVTDMSENTYTSTVTLNVKPKPLSSLGIGNIGDKITYGEEYNPVAIGTDELSVGGYKLEYTDKDNNVIDKPANVGKYHVTLIITNDNYEATSTPTVNFEIIPKEITLKVENIKDVYYDGTYIKQELTVKDEDNILKEDKDYKVSYIDNLNVGTAKLTIEKVDGGNYNFTKVEKTFNIIEELTSANLTLEKRTYRYNAGNEITPEPIIKNKAGKLLTKDSDYELTYENNKEIGNSAYVIITGKGFYKTPEPLKIQFSIVSKDAQEISFENSEITKIYGDQDFVAKAKLTVGDGTISYTSSNPDVATVDNNGNVTIKSAGNTTITATSSATSEYAETSATYNLIVNKRDISFTASIDGKTYDRNTHATIKDLNFNNLKYSETLTESVDYEVNAEFESSSAADSKIVKITLNLKDTDKTNNYNLTNTEYETRATIHSKSITDVTISVDDSVLIYDGNPKKTTVTITDGSYSLNQDVDYQLIYKNNTNAGTASIEISGVGNYSGTITKTFIIGKKTINPNIENIDAVTYNGEAQEPSIIVTSEGITLNPNTDYDTTYLNNTKSGTGTVKVTPKENSNYTFEEVTKTFNINKYSIQNSDITLEYETVVYSGTSKEPTVTVKMGNKIINPSNYDINYSNNTNVGTATVTVTIKADSENFEGSATKDFEIVDKTLLTISGIANNQKIVYTGSPVELVGNLTVSNDISASDLTIVWYKDGTEISKPTNVGTYTVEYSYEDDNYIGSLEIDFEIIKKTSSVPSITKFNSVAGDKLSTITLPEGFKWVNENEEVVAGNKEYSATYTENNDTENYTTETILVTVYGKSKVNLNTSVNGIGGIISSSKTDILEGTTETIIFTPNAGYEIDKVEVNGVDKTSSTINNKLDVVLGNNDINVVVTYKVIEYTITIKDITNATIDPSGIIKVDYNSNKEFIIKANPGYKLVSVKVNGVEKISDIVNDKLTLENILADAEIVVVAQKNVYEITEGANQKYIISKNNDAMFKINADYSKFENSGKVYVDDVLVDKSNYTSTSGSTIITLKKEYIDTLAVGVHTLKVEFNDGEATTTVTLANLKEETNPKTGDNIGLYIITGIISTLGIAGTGTYIYRKKQNN